MSWAASSHTVWCQDSRVGASWAGIFMQLPGSCEANGMWSHKMKEPARLWYRAAIGRRQATVRRARRCERAAASGTGHALLQRERDVMDASRIHPVAAD